MINFAVKLIATVALTAAEMALTMSQKIKGPRLDELKVTVADYGTPLPRFWGIRRFECPIMQAEDLREEKHTSKTKGGKFENYKYFGTFAVVIADQEIDAITRIWMDKHLVYDTTREGPISLAVIFGGADLNSTGPIKLSKDKNMRVYLGTESQTADPRMVSWCEDKYGPNSCPAYKGVAYIVFEEIPLEKFGNRIPQISVEAVSVKTVTHPYETKTTGLSSASNTFFFSPSGHWCAHSISGGQIEWWDTATRTNLGFSPSPGAATGSVANTAVAADGTAYQMGVFLSPASISLIITSPLGYPTLTATDSPTSQFSATRVLEYGTTRHIYTAYATHTGYLNSTIHTAHSQSARDFCLSSSGEEWALFHPSGASSNFTVESITNGTSYTIAGTGSRSGPNAAYITYNDTNAQLCVVTDGYFYAIDPTDGSINHTVAFSGAPAFVQGNPYRDTFWTLGGSTYDEYSLADGSLIRSLAKADWVATTDNTGSAGFDPVTNSVWVNENTTTNVIIRYIDRISSAGVTLGTVVDTVCDWCGLTSADTSALTQTVDGYSVTQGSGKDMIDPLLTIHDVDARPHDFSVQFLNRGSSPSGSILTADFAKNDPRYKVTIRQDTDLPKKVTFNFLDKDKDQQSNTAIAQRPLDAVDSQREETIDLTTYATSVNTAQQLADRYFRRVWNSREEVTLSLTAQKLALEPGDVTTISLDGALRNVKLDKMTIAGGQLDCTFIRDETSFAATNSATTGAVMDGSTADTISVPALSRGFIIDAPLAADADSDINPLIYYGVGPYAAGSFPGGVIYRGDDGTYDDLYAVIDTSEKATWGTCSSTLATADPWLWDRGNTLTVSLQSGTLTTVSEAAINSDPTLNLIAVGSVSGGWEYLNFTTATLVSGSTYTLSGFKRGRRGTEYLVATHAAGEAFVLVSTLRNTEMGTDDIGDAVSFKAQSIGRSIEAAPAIDLTYAGNTLKPYAPGAVKWYYDGTDLQGTLFRRTRVGGAWNGSTIPLSEATEQYEIDVYNGSTFKRTITATSTSFTYTAAMAASDGITLPTPPTIHAYQISAAVGRGFALAA